MTDFQTFLELIVVIGGVVYVTAQWRHGRQQSNKSLIETLQKRGDVFEQSLKEQKEESRKQFEEIIRLQEQLKAAKADNEKLLLILENRNPEMAEFMKLLTQTSKQASEYMNTTSANLRLINDFMVRIEKHLIN